MLLKGLAAPNFKESKGGSALYFAGSDDFVGGVVALLLLAVLGGLAKVARNSIFNH